MGKELSSTNDELHVVMFPFFAFGHISPFVQLSNKLSSSHGVRISFFSIPGYVSRIKSLLIPSPTTQIIPLQIPSTNGSLTDSTAGTSDLPPSEAGSLIEAVDLMQPQIKSLLSDLKPHFIVFDFAQYWLPSLASELGIKTLFFSVFSAVSGAYNTVPARLSGVEGDLTVNDLKKPPMGFPQTSEIRLKTFEARDFLFLFRSFDGGPSVFDRVISGLTGCSAIIMKTCEEIEGPYLAFMKSQFRKPVMLTGPLVPEPTSGELDEKWATWLSRFQPKTVVFCSFGSETFLNDDEIRELTLGLELTKLPFFLVLNFPANVDAATELERALPEGFKERVKDRGVVYSGWVQQQQILAHASVGCYLCHSGFSSIIEAWVNDCQLALLPFKGDQFMNSKLIGLDLKAGVEVKRRDEDGHFAKEDIYEALKKIMVEVEEEPGKTVRVNHQKWRSFLLEKNIQDKFISDMAMEMKAMAMATTPTTCT
ncbi:anthocyanidin-3-O-glucoside rhamnosyltransferase-like [Humulus lupulus]|uniref:anthocyanidin-3-O-glucoside rhamnosyltransferase-like n=1 Tax=Humulus lupulus TaxID=3486 RepID=UPI002B41064F|nr:anthocyanidin-3-O-glucoside rhamnosyltransferase-like [Humulus lupulus]